MIRIINGVIRWFFIVDFSVFFSLANWRNRSRVKRKGKVFLFVQFSQNLKKIIVPFDRFKYFMRNEMAENMNIEHQ